MTIDYFRFYIGCLIRLWRWCLYSGFPIGVANDNAGTNPRNSAQSVVPLSTNYEPPTTNYLTCQFCTFANPIVGLPDGILVCDHSPAGEKSYTATTPSDCCDNFQPADTAPPIVISTGVPHGQRLSFRAQPRNPLNQHRRRRFHSNSKSSIENRQWQGTRLIPVKGGPFAVVDAADYDKLSKYKWWAIHDATTSYAVTRKNRKRIFMHRLIINAPKGLVVHHIDHNGFNNTRRNLRLCTQRQNQYNRRPRKGCTSKYKGVSWGTERRRFCAEIAQDRKRYVLGYFTDEREAARAYDKKAKELFGEFAYLNFPAEHAESDEPDKSGLRCAQRVRLRLRFAQLQSPRPGTRQLNTLWRDPPLVANALYKIQLLPTRRQTRARPATPAPVHLYHARNTSQEQDQKILLIKGPGPFLGF